MKIIYMHCGEETNIRDPHSYEHYWTISWNKTRKNWVLIIFIVLKTEYGRASF